MRTPHDLLFKIAFERPENAASALRAVLPDAFVRRADWSTLTVERGHFTSDAQGELRTDLLFSLRVGRRKILFYVLKEHQSTPVRMMPLRVLGYMVAIWSHYLQQNPRARFLPPIIPVVVYHGDRPWLEPRTMGELFDLGGEPALASFLRGYLPQFRLVLDDLTRVAEAEIWRRSLTDMAALTLLLLKTARHSTTVAADLRRWAKKLARVARAPDGLAAATALLEYAIQVGQMEPGDVRELSQSLGPELQEVVMTAAQKLKEEGRVEGRAEGRAEVLLRQLRRKFTALPPDVEQRVRSASPEELDRFADQILDATSLEEVLH